MAKSIFPIQMYFLEIHNFPWKGENYFIKIPDMF